MTARSGTGALSRPAAAERWERPLARWAWLVAVAAIGAGWYALYGAASGTEARFLDWDIYAKAWNAWLAAGTPYTVPPTGWNPCVTYPYLYPPTSWPILVLAGLLPPVAAWLGVVPLLARPPRLWAAPVAVALLGIGLVPALYLSNVDLLVAALVVLAFVPGPIGGLALAGAVALKGYPIVLLPFLWRDGARLRALLIGLAVLAVSGTLLFGFRGWTDFVATLAGEGPSCSTAFNPFLALGAGRVIAALIACAAGLLLRSPALALLGATFLTGVVTQHYLVTIAAALLVEPALRGRRAISLAPPRLAAV